MSTMLDIFKNHKPIENPEFGSKKKLIGDAVAQCSELSSIVSKKGASWLVLKCEAINCIPDSKGRETTVKPGDALEKLYNPNDNDSMVELANDLFTAGIDVNRDVATEEDLLVNMQEAVKGKLIYFRTWAKDKNAEQMAKNPMPSFFQNINIKSKNLITPENSTAQVPF